MSRSAQAPETRFGPTTLAGGLAFVDSHASERALRGYLETLFGSAPESEFLEVRYRVRSDAFATTFYDSHDFNAAARAIRERARNTDVYVGCAPRTRRAGTKDAVGAVHVLWAECDGPSAARAALSWTPAPSVVVASGSGDNIHAYWPLSRPLAPTDAEAANLRLARALGADAVCFDAGRILRPPGTWNHKHQPPRPVGLMRLERGRTFDAGDVVARCPDVDLTPVVQRWRRQPARDVARDPLLRILPEVYVTELLGSRPSRARKVRCPFHDDERPSLHVYAAPERGWHCFSCRRGGSVYDLAAELWGFGTRGPDFVELRRRLADRFRHELATSLERDRR